MLTVFSHSLAFIYSQNQSNSIIPSGLLLMEMNKNILHSFCFNLTADISSSLILFRGMSLSRMLQHMVDHTSGWDTDESSDLC